jgi:type IV secretory pathway VirB3-like protein
MAKLKRKRLFAPRQAIIASLGIPLNVALYFFIAIIATMILFRGWRSWLTLFCIWTLLAVGARLRVKRDHNAFRCDGLWLNTKAFFMDADIWRGVTLRSWPPPPNRLLPRGIPPR